MIEELEVLSLQEDLPELGLKRGDLGTAVYVYPDGNCEVEFVSSSGQTIALLTLDSTRFVRARARIEEPAGAAESHNRPTLPRPLN